MIHWRYQVTHNYLALKPSDTLPRRVRFGSMTKFCWKQLLANARFSKHCWRNALFVHFYLLIVIKNKLAAMSNYNSYCFLITYKKEINRLFLYFFFHVLFAFKEFNGIKITLFFYDVKNTNPKTPSSSPLTR